MDRRHCRLGQINSLIWPILIALYLGTGVAYILVTPILEKSDEQGHYGYILYLRERQALPPLEVVDELSFEFKQPPLYYGLVWLFSGTVAVTPFDLPEKNPYIDLASPYQRNDNRAVYLHPPYHTAVGIIGRAVSLVFGLGTVGLTYRLAWELFDQDKRAAMGSALLIGFHPRFFYMATAVNNDAGAAFFGAAISLLLLLRYKRPGFYRFPFVMGAVLGLALLMKTSSVLFLPLIALALLLHPHQTTKNLVREGAIIAIVASLIGGWWYLRNALVYGDAVTLQAHLGDGYTIVPQLDRLIHTLLGIEYTFWGNLARPTLKPIAMDYSLIWWGRVSSLILLLGLVRSLIRSRLSREVVVLLTIPSAFLVVLAGFWNASQAFTFGRLLFPALSALVVLWVWGWYQAIPGVWRTWALHMSGGMMLCIGVLTPFVSIYPLYHPYRPFQAAKVIQLPSLFYVDERNTEIAELIGYRLAPDPAVPGNYTPIELCWRSLGRTQAPVAVLVQLLAVNELANPGGPTVFGGRRTYPGLGNLPTDRWPVGKTFCDGVMIQLRKDTPTPTQTLLEVGFISPRDGSRLSVVDAEGNAAMAILAGPVVLTDDPSGHSLVPARYLMDQAIGLVSVETEPRDNTLFVTLAWQSHRPVGYDAVVFVHLYDALGTMLSQVDALPMRGRFSTSAWIPGQMITDSYELALPAQYKPPLSIHLGMYHLHSLQRLAVVDSDNAQQTDNLITISVGE